MAILNPGKVHNFLKIKKISTLQILTQLPAILKEEEDEAYTNEVGLSENDDILNKQHNAAVRTIAIGHIVEKVCIHYL